MRSAKSVKSVKSMKSMKSVRSFKSYRTTTEDYNLYHPFIFEEFYPSICVRFECPRPVMVRKEQAENEPYMKSVKPSQVRMRSRRSDASQMPQYDAQSVVTAHLPEYHEVDNSIIQVVSVYGSFNNLTAIIFTKLTNIPRALIQCLAIVAPVFEDLTKVCITRSTLRPIIIHELNKMARTTHITDVCLDGCILHEANYAQLLENASNLKNLSLSRCSISDEVCNQLFSYLHHPLPMEGRLLVINLTSNHITDIGAKFISDALRSNRHLRHLNLAGNHITDTGAASIFNILRQFPLTQEELYSSKQKHITYLRTLNALSAQYFQDLSAKSSEPVEVQKKGLIKKRKTSANSISAGMKSMKYKGAISNALEHLKTKATLSARETMGPFSDPFSSGSVSICNGWTFCKGNFTLCYLNLAYNNLTFASVLTLEKVLIHQNTYAKLNQPGLLKLVLAGNKIPDQGPEMDSLTKLLNRNMVRCSGKRYSDSGRRKSRTPMISAGFTQKTKAQ